MLLHNDWTSDKPFLSTQDQRLSQTTRCSDMNSKHVTFCLSISSYGNLHPTCEALAEKDRGRDWLTSL